MDMNPEILQEGGVASMGKQLHFHQLNHNTTNVRGCDREQAVFMAMLRERQHRKKTKGSGTA